MTQSQRVRLYLCRHSETAGNLAGLVLGQSDSVSHTITSDCVLTYETYAPSQILLTCVCIQPVTQRGIEQAQALGRTRLIRETTFQRYYTSDCTRAVETTRMVLESASRSDAPVTLEPLLRELAKGAREGYPKSVSYEEALRARQNHNNDAIPLVETDDEAWNRIHAFIHRLLEEIAAKSEKTPKDPFNVFVMSHSAILRIFLRRLIGDDHLYNHPCARFDSGGIFYIPNTSLTILDVGLDSNSAPSIPEERRSPYHNFHVDIIQLTWADHLGKNAEAAHAE